MILVDTNVWLALALETHVSHGTARQWFAPRSAAKSICFCRPTQLSFLRLLTTEKVMQAYGEVALSNQSAWRVYEGFRSDPRISWLEEPAGIENIWKTLASRATSSPKVWMDAYLAAFAIAGGQEFLTLDQAFSQFNGLKVTIL